MDDTPYHHIDNLHQKLLFDIFPCQALFVIALL